MEMSLAGLVENRGLTKTFYVDSGASDHLIPSRGELRAYKEFASPVEIAAADNGKVWEPDLRLGIFFGERSFLTFLS